MAGVTFHYSLLTTHYSLLTTHYSLPSFDIVEPAKPPDQRIGADRDHEQHDQQRIHQRHVEQAVGLDHQEADAAVGELGLGEQRADQADAEPDPHPVDDRVAHRRQIDLGHHLPGVGAEASADPDQHLVDLAHAARDIERDREEAGDRAHRDLRARADTEPHEHHRKEDDLRARPEIVEHRLIGPPQQPGAAERNAGDEAAQATDH